VFHDNNRDLFVEVSHGPYLVEHNILASPAALELFSQGGAFVHNLICGTVRLEPVMDRATPYHRPHSTQVAGYAVIIGGDDRWVGNVFVGGDAATAYGAGREGIGRAVAGTAGYDGYPASFEEYLARVAAQPPGDHKRFLHVKQPVYARCNVYAAGAAPFAGETDALAVAAATASVVVEDDGVYLETKLPAEFDRVGLEPITGRDLERVRIADANFEEPDGTPAVMDVDVAGEHKQPGRRFAAGPIADLSAGSSRTQVW
jgi:hypothetical protein